MGAIGGCWAREHCSSFPTLPASPSFLPLPTLLSTAMISMSVIGFVSDRVIVRWGVMRALGEGIIGNAAENALEAEVEEPIDWMVTTGRFVQLCVYVLARVCVYV